MTKFTSYYWGGPRSGQRRVDYTPSAQRIPIYEDATSELNCADEQVIKLLGTYEKRATRFSDVYCYVWKPNVAST